MRFGWGRAAAAQHDASDDGDARPEELARVELLLDDGTIEVGWIGTAGQRTSDWLNASTEVAIYGRSSPESAPSAPPDPAIAGPEPLARDRIAWVVPPALPPNRHLRLHRRRVLLHLELDGWSVSGQAHVRPGADATDQVLRGTRDLVPLTEVQVAPRTMPGEPIALSVLIVNRRHVRGVTEGTADAPDGPAMTTEELRSDPRLALLAATVDAEAEPTPTPADADSGVDREAAGGAEAEGEADPDLRAALQALLDASVIDVVEFQSIRARLPQPPA